LNSYIGSRVYSCTEVGFSLRKDDPTALCQLLIDIHSKSSNVDVTTFNDPYVHFLAYLLYSLSYLLCYSLYII